MMKATLTALLALAITAPWMAEAPTFASAHGMKHSVKHKKGKKKGKKKKKHHQSSIAA